MKSVSIPFVGELIVDRYRQEAKARKDEQLKFPLRPTIVER